MLVDRSLQPVDYLIMAIVLAVPMGIGIFYAWKDFKKQTKNEYLLGGKNMMMLPVALSIFVTHQSAVSLMGFPSDVYMFGPMIIPFHIGISLSYLIGYFTMVPLLYPLQLTSIYQYLEIRYKSKAVRFLCTFLGMLQNYFLMALVQLAPGLALQAVVGIPLWLSVAIVGSIGTVYTAIGGIKSVLWTDTFQTAIVFFGIFALIVKGIITVGGVEKAWRIAEDGGRTNFNHFTPDPRLRYSWWGTVIGICVTWLTNICSQPIGQRLTAMRSMTSAKRAYLVNVPLPIIYGTLLTITGLIMYAYFYTVRCDPFKAGLISNMNQAAPFFMLHVFEDLPGMAGLYMAMLFSGSLSSVSSGINALAANTIEELLGKCLHGASEKKVTVLAKTIVFMYGTSLIGMTYLIKSVDGPLPQVGVSILAACGSAVLSMFIMGCTVPWANKYGAFAGGLASHALIIWIVVGNLLYGNKPKPLPAAPTDRCFSPHANNSFNNVVLEMNMESPVGVSVPLTDTTTPISAQSITSDDWGFFLYDISYEWYSVIGLIVCITSGLLVSRLTRGKDQSQPDGMLILPCLRQYWSSYEPSTTVPENDEESPRNRFVIASPDDKADVEISKWL